MALGRNSEKGRGEEDLGLGEGVCRVNFGVLSVVDR